MTTSLAEGVVYRSERECIDGVEAAFHAALAIAWGGAEVEIVREGTTEVAELSACEMLTIIAAVGDTHARAAVLITGRSAPRTTMGKSTSPAEDYPPIEADLVLPTRAKALGAMCASGNSPTLRPFLAAVREVSENRRALLARIRSAIQQGARDEVVDLARQLVGLGDDAAG